MIFQHTCATDIETIKRQMEGRAKEHGFGLLKAYSFQTMLDEKGFPIDNDITVFELCNPAAAQEALRSHPEISVYLPCRISLYQENGATVISTIGFEEIMEVIKVDNLFKGHMDSIYGKLKDLIMSWS